MKKVFLILLLLGVSGFISYGQKQFSNKEDALKWLKEAFSKNFVKTAVNETENKKDIGVIESEASQYFDYEFTDKYLLISRKNRNFQMPNWFTLLPFDKISIVAPINSSEDAFYKQATHIYIRSDCNCFKYSVGKKFKGENSFDELQNYVLFPFNLNEEKDIGMSLENAFAVLAGKIPQPNSSLEGKTSTPKKDVIIEKYTLLDVAKWKKLYEDIALPNQKNDLSINNLHGTIKKIKTTYNNVEENNTGQQVLKMNFIIIDNYNQAGYITKNEMVSGDTPEATIAFEYNNKNLIIAKVALKDSSVVSRFTYDKLLTGGIQKTEIQDDDFSKNTTIYYNENLVETKFEQKDNKEITITKYKHQYDQFNNTLSREAYKNDTLSSKMNFTYNKANICTKTQYYNAKGVLQWSFDVKLDSKNRTIETVRTDINKEIQKVVIGKFDANNNFLSYQIYSNGQIKKVIEFQIEYY